MKRGPWPLSFATFVLAGAGCGGPPAPAPRVVQVRAPQPTVQAPAGAATPPPPALAPVAQPERWPHDVSLPGAPACTFSRSRFSGSMRLDRDSAPFAFLDGDGESDVHLPQDAPQAPAVIEASFGPLTLRGVVRTDELELRPTDALILGGLLWLKPEATLGIVRAGPGVATVKLAEPIGELTEVTVPLEVDARCAQLGFRHAGFDPRDDVGETITLSRLVGWKVPASTSPGGAPVARITVPAGEPEVVSVVAREGRQSRIVFDPGGALVVAWVPSTSLRPVPDSVSGLGLGGRGRDVPPIVHSGGRGTFVSCREALPIGVLQDGVSRRVGTFASRVQVETGETIGDVTVVAFEHRGLGLHQGARLVARNEDLARCEASHP